MHFLVVEDQDVMRDSLCGFLQAGFPQARILEAGTVARALELCREHAPQLALLDVHLPDGNGIELARRLKSCLPALAIVVVSYLTGQHYVDAAIAAGAHAYLPKDRLHAELIGTAAQALALAGHRSRP
ncbi:MAG: response regulator [Burkholderiales bacterium]